MQMYYVLDAIVHTSGANALQTYYDRIQKDPKSSKTPFAARELLLDQFFIPFIFEYLASVPHCLTISAS